MTSALADSALLFALGASGAEGHAPHGGVPWGTLLFMATNVTLFALVLRRYAWPIVRRSLQERHCAIREEMEAAAREREEAERLRKEWERRVAGLAAELEEMRRRTRELIAAERERLLAEARRTAGAILRDAQRMAEQEFRNAQRRLRAEIASRAFELAVGEARSNLTDADHQRFTRRFIEEVRQ